MFSDPGYFHSENEVTPVPAPSQHNSGQIQASDLNPESQVIGKDICHLMSSSAIRSAPWGTLGSLAFWPASCHTNSAPEVMSTLSAVQVTVEGLTPLDISLIKEALGYSHGGLCPFLALRLLWLCLLGKCAHFSSGPCQLPSRSSTSFENLQHTRSSSIYSF